MEEVRYEVLVMSRIQLLYTMHVLYRLLRCNLNYDVEVSPWYICLYVGCAQEVHKVFVSENTKLTCYVPNTARMYVNIELYIQHLLYKEKCVYITIFRMITKTHMFNVSCINTIIASVPTRRGSSMVRDTATIVYVHH